MFIQTTYDTPLNLRSVWAWTETNKWASQIVM